MGGGDDSAASAESGLQLSSLIPAATSTSSTCSASVSSVRLCDDTFSYTNSSIGTGDSIAAEVLCFSPEPTDAEEEAEDVQKKARKVSGGKAIRVCTSPTYVLLPVEMYSSTLLHGLYHDRGRFA